MIFPYWRIDEYVMLEPINNDGFIVNRPSSPWRKYNGLLGVIVNVMLFSKVLRKIRTGI